MSNRQIISCDAPNCGKDITEGQGRNWHLSLFSVVGKMAAGTVPRHDSGQVLQMQHLCDEHCLTTWATAAAAAKDEAQTKFEADAQAKAEAAKATT